MPCACAAHLNICSLGGRLLSPIMVPNVSHRVALEMMLFPLHGAAKQGVRWGGLLRLLNLF